MQSPSTAHSAQKKVPASVLDAAGLKHLFSDESAISLLASQSVSSMHTTQIFDAVSPVPSDALSHTGWVVVVQWVSEVQATQVLLVISAASTRQAGVVPEQSSSVRQVTHSLRAGSLGST